MATRDAAMLPALECVLVESHVCTITQWAEGALIFDHSHQDLS